MKAYLIFALVWTTILKLVADERPESKLSLTIESMSRDGQIQVGIHNKSADMTNVWSGGCSWGYFNWRIIDVRNNETRLYCPNPYEGFTVNFPQFVAIKPGAMMATSFKLGGDYLMHWVGPKDTQPLL
jgi:hypothetical protein